MRPNPFAARALRLAVWRTLCALGLLAQDLKTVQPQGYVSDFANVLDAATRQRIEAYCARRGAGHRACRWRW